jgi:hypothetical protein
LRIPVIRYHILHHWQASQEMSSTNPGQKSSPYSVIQKWEENPKKKWKGKNCGDSRIKILTCCENPARQRSILHRDKLANNRWLLSVSRWLFWFLVRSPASRNLNNR